MRTYEELRVAVKNMGYEFFMKNLSLNMIWERTSHELTNHFTDFLHVTYLNDKKEKVITIPATTKPGIKGSIDTGGYTVEGITGTAIIIPGQYRKAWQFRDTFEEFSKYPYFKQVGPISYWRDGDKDLEIDETKETEQVGKIFGTHWHKMSQPGIYGNGQVNNWSKGCMGWPEPELKKILAIVRLSVNLYGDKFTGTILETTDFK